MNYVLIVSPEGKKEYHLVRGENPVATFLNDDKLPTHWMILEVIPFDVMMKTKVVL